MSSGELAGLGVLGLALRVSLGGWLLVNLAHVAGHLLMARLLGIRVHRVTFGLGKTLRERTVRGTTYRIALFPLAIRVRLERPGDGSAPGPAPDPDEFRSRPLAQRLAVVLAAPAMLLVLALVLAVAVQSQP